jgi:hypothetical protein
MGMLDMGLQFEGAPEELINAVDAALPILQNKLGPDAEKLEAIFAKSQPLAVHLAQAWPVIVAAFPDIKAVGPTLWAFIKFASTLKT